MRSRGTCELHVGKGKREKDLAGPDLSRILVQSGTRENANSFLSGGECTPRGSGDFVNEDRSRKFVAQTRRVRYYFR